MVMVVVNRAERATIVPFFSLAASTNRLGRHVDAQIDHLETAAFEHRGHQVLADVVQVALHCADDDPPDRLGARLGQHAA